MPSKKTGCFGEPPAASESQSAKKLNFESQTTFYKQLTFQLVGMRFGIAFELASFFTLLRFGKP